MLQKRIKIIFPFLLFWLIWPNFAFASQAAVVVKKQSGEVKSACVNFDTDSITGWQLLEKAGFRPVAKNGFVVGIDGETTKNSTQMLSDDAFWSYWKYKDSWVFQNVGANYSRVEDGDIEGWELGRGQCSLSKIIFSQICAEKKSSMSSATAVNSSTVEKDQSSQNNVIPAVSTPTNTQVTGNNTNDDSRIISVNDDNETQKKNPSPSVKAGEAIRSNAFNFPEFSLKNVLILFGLFLSGGIIFVFLKVAVRKFVNGRQNQKRG